MEDVKQLKKLAKDYLNARKAFLSEVKHDHPEMGGNDNIVGRIGEFVAIIFLRSQDRSITKCKSATNKGYDLLCSSGRQISVKTITAESKSGKSTILKQPWQELIMVYIDENYQVQKIGHIHLEQFEMAVQQKFIKREPKADKRFLSEGNLFDTYGKLYSGNLIDPLF